MNDRKPAIVPIREQIYHWVQEAILTNQYKPGDVIQIDKLARDFGVSATPIRETFIRLEGSGLLTLIPNKGAVVTEFDEQDIRNTWEMRKLLEPYAGRVTASLEILSQIETLETNIQKILDGDRDLQFYIETDSAMHELLFTHLDNNLLKETIQRIHRLSNRMRYFAESIKNNHEQVICQVCREHLAILEALKNHDPDAAEQAVFTHITNSEQRTLASARKAER